MNDYYTPLGRVIDAAQQENGWSLNQLGERAKELQLKGLTKSNIANMKRERQQHLSTSTLKNLAVLIRVPERVVVAAALQSTNLEFPEARSTGAAEAIASDLTLSERDKRILLAALTAITEEKAGDGDAEATPPTRAAGSAANDDGLGAFGHRDRGDLDHESINDGAGENVHPLRPDLDNMAAYRTGKETEKQRLLREEAERENESQDPDDWE